MKNFRKLFSFLLAVCILAAAVPIAGAAGGTHSLASVSVQGNTASVRLTAESGCSLLVAQYAEDGRLLNTITTAVENRDGYQTLSVPLQETESAFDLKAFLVDSTTGTPLCSSYAFKNAGTAGEHSSILGLDAEEGAIVATVTSCEACTMEVQIWDETENELLFTTSAEVAANPEPAYVSAGYDTPLPARFVLWAVLKDADGNAVSNPYVNRRNTDTFLSFADLSEADFRGRTDLTFLEVGNEDDSNFIVLNDNVTYLNCSANSNTFAGESGGILTFKNAEAPLTGLEPGSLFAFVNEEGAYETVKVRDSTLKNGTASVIRDE